MIENRLNNRPRKRLGFRTPSEVFHQSLRRVCTSSLNPPFVESYPIAFYVVAFLIVLPC